MEHFLEIDLLLAIRTSLFLANDAPAPNAEFVKHVFTAELVSVLDNAFFKFRDKELIAAHRADVRVQRPGWHASRCIVLQRNVLSKTISKTI